MSTIDGQWNAFEFAIPFAFAFAVVYCVGESRQIINGWENDNDTNEVNNFILP